MSPARSELTGIFLDLKMTSEIDFLIPFAVTSDDSVEAPFFDSSADLDSLFGTSLEPQYHRASGADSLTISPKDIMADSEPPSTTFTDLTTPETSFFDSPYMADSTNPSPLFAQDNLDSGADNWYPLFGDDNQNVAGPDADSSTTEIKPPIVNVAPQMSRQASSPGQSSSRGSHQGHHFFSAGVGAKRRDKPLPPIRIDELQDVVAVKRARNTLAARKSRQKRVERNEELVAQVGALEKEVEHWKQIALNLGHVR